MVLAATAFTGFALLVGVVACSNAYFFAVRKARGQAPQPSVSEIFGGLADEGLSAMIRRAKDPQIESKRRRAWLAVAVWLAYMVLGYHFWSAVAGLLSR